MTKQNHIPGPLHQHGPDIHIVYEADGVLHHHIIASVASHLVGQMHHPAKVPLDFDGPAVAKQIVLCVNTHADLLEACQEQHKAIDTLFAILIATSPNFFPSKSGQPWGAIQMGHAAIAKAEKES